MPMSFPDFQSLKNAARVHKFREPMADESEDAFREALAFHVQKFDIVEAMEIRAKVGWDQFSEAQNLGLLLAAMNQNRKD